MKSTETPFNIPNLLYIDDGAFIFKTLKGTKKAAQIIFNHFAKFGLEMHIGIETEKDKKGKETSKSNTGENSKSKTEAMYFSPSLKEAQENEAHTEKLLLNDGSNSIPFIKKIRYLGTLITPELKKTLRSKPE